MHPSISGEKFTVGQLLARLKKIYQPNHTDLAKALDTSYTTYLKIERDRRELSFLMALRICQFYKLDIHEFISMLSDEELGRNDLSVLKVRQQRKKKKEEAAKAKAKVIEIKT